jgi:YbbR domain-containing protein
LTQKKFRLKPILYGSPATGFHVAKISVSPSRITLEAPTGVLQSLDSLQTMPIDIQGDHENLTVEPKIDYQGKQVKILEKNITVHITLERTRQ